MKLLLTAMLCMAASSAYAFEVCNSFQEKQNLAFAYYDGSSYVSKGWYIVEGRQCEDFSFPNLTDQYYIYFEDSQNRKSIGNIPFCVSRPGPFSIASANKLAAQRACSYENFALTSLSSNTTLYLGQIFDPIEDTDPPTDDSFSWVGAIEYEGGLLKQGPASLDGVYASSIVKLDLSSCNERLRVLRVEAVENNRVYKAELQNSQENTYQFPRTVAIQSLLISLNGPVAGDLIPCSIPIFIPDTQTRERKVIAL